MQHFFYFLACVWVFFFSFETMNAQRTISGTVKDAETLLPLDAANVVLQAGDKTVDYSITNAEGEFKISTKHHSDSLRLVVSSLGYKKFDTFVRNNSLFHIKLKPTSIQLKEVTIRPGRIWGRNDTIRFDASQFLKENDKSVEDLMKRLPGINVDDNGNIQYNGKDIGAMYVEGLDMMGSRYKSISKNLSAKSIKGVEVLDNHQRIKSLVGKVPSDVPDINLKLKDDFKDKWNMNGKLSSGFSPEKFLYELEANAMQIAKKSQSLYSVKTSNTGNGITKEGDEGYSTLLPLPTYQLLRANKLSAPLKEPRWLFDNAIIATANRLYKTGEDSRLKLNAFYTHNDAYQERNEKSTYFNVNDTVDIEENKTLQFKKDAFNFSTDYENNHPSHFLRNKLDLRLSREKSATDISGSYQIAENIESIFFSLKDNLSLTKKLKNGNLLTAQAVMGYWHNKEALQFEDYDSFNNFHGVYAKAIGGIAISKTKIAQNYSIGTTLNFNNIKTHHQLNIKPTYEYLFGSFRLNWGFPIDIAYFPNDSRTLLLPKVNTSLKYKINYAWNARLYAQYAKDLDNIAMSYNKPYFSNYRTQIDNEVATPTSKKQFYKMRIEYKNTLSAFFFTSDFDYFHNRTNHTLGQEVNDGVFQLTHHNTSHSESSTSYRATLSKGLFDPRAKLSLDFSWSKNSSAQIRNKALVDFSFQNMSITPKFSISPSDETELSYEANIGRSKSSFAKEKNESSLWNMHHKLSFSYTVKGFESLLTGEYFRNQIANNKNVNLFYVDFIAGYKFKKISLWLSLKNISNQTNYQYTLYNPLSIYTSQLSLRPREFLISARFRL